MAKSAQAVLLFGDQSDAFTEAIDYVCRQAEHQTWLRKFLDDAAAVLHSETSRWRHTLRESLGTYHTIQELSDQFRHKDDDTGLAHGLLVFIMRQCLLLQCVRKDPTLISNAQSISVCGGYLNAAALDIAKDYDTLYEASLELFRILCRLERLAYERAKATDLSNGSWACAIAGISAEMLQVALDRYHRSMRTPEIKKVKIAVVGQGWSTIIGPPTSLNIVVQQCAAIKSLPRRDLRLRAPFHTLTLSEIEVSDLLGSSPLLDLPAGTVLWRSVVKLACEHVLTRPYDLAEAVKDLDHRLGPVDNVDLNVIGPSSHANSVTNQLGACGKRVTTRHEHTSIHSSQDSIPDNLGKIAIVGIGGQSPGADDLEDFWRINLAGRDLHKQVPEDRFDLKEFYSPTHDGICTTNAQYGCFVDRPGAFDARFFNVSHREALLMEPCHRLWLMSVYEALESAGYSQNRTRTTDPHRIGAFFGQSVSDWRATTHPRGCNSYDLQGVQRAFAPGRVNYHFKWEGPSYNIDSACASSASAINLACQNLLLGEIDMAVAGGANAISSPHAFCELSRAGVLSVTGNCKTFRDDADGYCRGEFSGAVVLKRIEDAIAANDNILAVIAASGRNSSGNASSITTSDAGAQQRLFRQVLGKAHVAPEDISYVEMHGTGTPVGDLAEMTAVTNTFGRSPTDDIPLRVGALKANLGHSESAAGIASLLKCVLALQKEVIPPVANMPHALNPEFPDLKKLKVEILSHSVDFKASEDRKRRIILNNFDASGGNSCMLIEDFAAKIPKSQDPRSSHVITVSAKTAASQKHNKKKLLQLLQSSPEQYRIEDLAYTTTARRIQHPYCTAIPASSVHQLIEKLDAEIKSDVKPVRVATSPVIFMFTGQGSDYGGMGAALYKTNTAFRDILDLCVTVSNQHELPEFLDIIIDPLVENSKKTTVQTQLALVCLEIALSSLWKTNGVEPAMVMGHSLGEYAAFFVAGVLSLADVLLLVGRRAQLVNERCEEHTRTMLSVATSSDKVTHYLSRHPSCEIACLNSPRATVVSGTLQAIQSLQTELERDGIRSQRLQVPYAFHSNQIDGILGDYTTIARGVTFCAPKVPIASSLSATIIDKADIINEKYLVRHTRENVNFAGALTAAAKSLDNPVFLEVGPKRVLGSFVQASVSTSTTGRILSTLEGVNEDWASISKALASLYNAGVAIDWTAFHEPYTKHVNMVPLPAYSWDLTDYWLKWTEPRGGHVANNTVETSTSEVAKPISSILHFVEKQSLSPRLEFTFRSSATDPYLKALVTGHRFLTVPCCPGGVYCEIGMEAAKHALQASGKGLPELTVMNTAFHRPFTIPDGAPKAEIITTITMPRDDIITAKFAIRNASTTFNIGDCEYKFANRAALQTQWDSTSYFIKSRMDLVIKMTGDGEGHRFRGNVFYTLFARCLDYDEAYKGIKEAFVTEDFREAVAKVVLQEDPSRSSSSSVYWTESLVHLAGFVANANPAHPVGSSFITNGFKAIEQTAELRAGGTYYSYVRVAKSDDESITCDIFVFDSEDQLIMQCTSLAFRKVDNVSLERALGKVSVAPARASKAPKPAVSRTSVVNGTANFTKPTTTPNNTTRPTKSKGVGVVDTLLANIAAETGTDVAELTDDAVFSELGVDSIMAMQIVAAVKKATGSDVPSAFVFEYPTVGSIRKELGHAQGSVEDDLTTVEEGPIERSPVEAAHVNQEPTSSVLKSLIQSISDETGTEVADLTDDALLSELGCDSIMALQIASTVKRETDRDIPGSFVLDNPSIGDVRRAFGGAGDISRTDIISPPQTTSTQREEAPAVQVNGFVKDDKPVGHEPSSIHTEPPTPTMSKNPKPETLLFRETPEPHVNGVVEEDPALMDFTDVPEAKLILMQGRSSSKETPLFLMSDGFGTPASYIHLPRFKSGLPVYAIESAFLRCPGKLPKNGIPAIAKFAVEAMIKARPDGPYLLGGFSGGATIAYEMCRQLAASGRKLQGLILIDMCCPRVMDESTDLMAKNGLPLVQRLLPPTQPSALTSNHRAKFGPIHLRRVVQAVCHYGPPALAPKDRPVHSCIIWARQGLVERARKDSQALAIMADMKLKTEAPPGFMTDVSLGPAAWSVPTKTGIDLGPNGWDEFLGNDVKVLVADADHMSMPVPPDVRKLHSCIEEALRSFK